MSASAPPVQSARQQPCDLCQHTSFETIATSDRLGQPLTTVICCRCGLISHEHLPTDQELAEYYARQYRQDYHGEITPAAHRVVRAWEGGQWLLRLLLPHVPPGSQVAEIGAGIGCTVKAFELAGFHATGIEPGHGFHSFARDQLRAQIECQNLFDLPARPTYDFLLLVHVIEHLNSPRQALTHLRAMLRPQGRLYVECPNIAAPHAAPGKQFHVAHIHNFTPETLTALAQACGFRIEAQLASENDQNLRYVLERTETVVPANGTVVLASGGGYEAIRQNLRRQSRWKYYLRPRYWLQRIERDLRFARQRIGAKRRLKKILQTCRQHRLTTSATATRAA